jgi:hypothetical protein
MAYTRISFRRDTAAEWETVNPVLNHGEIGLIVDSIGQETALFKIGDGTTAWNDLPIASGPRGETGAQGETPPLSDSVTNADSNVAASSAAVKTAYDRGSTAQSRADAAYARTRTPLTADTTFYLSATGNDTNDGTAPEKAKGTPAGIQALLNSVDNRGYKITVVVSGKIETTSSAFLFDFPDYDDSTLEFVGESTETDGFLGDFRIQNGVFSANNLSFGRIFAYEKGTIRIIDRKIRLTGSATPGYGIQSNINGEFVRTVIELTGAYTSIFFSASGGQNNFTSCTFKQVSDLTYNYLGRARSFLLVEGCTYDGDALPSTGYTFEVLDGAFMFSNSTTLPGGNTYNIGRQGRGSTYGTARAIANISSTGVLSTSRGFGISSVTKTGTGVYRVNHSLNNYISHVTPYPIPDARAVIGVIDDSVGGQTTVRIFNDGGTATDAGFNIEIF